MPYTDKTIDPISILEKAELNHQEGNFTDALTQYIWFFEKAVDIDKTYRGAKLVRCLIAWHNLSKIYIPAYKKLLEKKDFLYTQLTNNPNKDDYLDFVKICNQLDLTPESINLFKFFHENNNNFAKEIFSDIREYLFESKEFTLCEIYIDNPNKLYQEQLLLLDNLLYIDKHYYENEFSTVYKGNFLKSIEYILNTLKVTYRTTEINHIICFLENDMQERNIQIKIDDKN